MIDVSMNFVIHPNLFSIIMPTYNRENLIVHSLDSVHAQTYRPVEIIIVDDGSIDNTAHVVDDWRRANEEQKGFHVKYVYQKNAGNKHDFSSGYIFQDPRSPQLFL
jgi:Glycosyltransferases involved in cell wall biogenesis